MYTVCDPIRTFYIERLFVISPSTVVITFGGLCRDIVSGKDTVCLQMWLNWLCSTSPYCHYFFDDISDQQYSIWRNESISSTETDELRASVPNL